MTRKVTGPHKRGDSLNQRFSEVPVYIGSIPKLAQGEINPMWSISDSLPSIAKIVAPILASRRQPKDTTPSKNAFMMKKEELEEQITDDMI